jgi:hypothetical protein
MNEQEFIKNFTQVENWVNTMRPHWAHLKGDVHNDKDFWAHCIHSIKADVWTAWCHLYGELNQSHPGYFRKHSYIYEDTVTIATRIDKGEAITKPYNKTGYNKPAFRAAMAIKDIIAEITERPFITVETPQPQKKAKPTPQEVQAQFDKAQAMLKELFE